MALLESIRDRFKPKPAPPPTLFQSFWMGGFESATHINRFRRRLDMLAVTQHDRFADTDYALLRSIGMGAARDAARWHLIERDGRFDFDSLAPMVRAARAHDVQVIWTLCHYGWPRDIDVFAPDFPARFARFAGAVARFIAQEDGRVPFYAPINEISYLTWNAGDAGNFYPFARGRGHELKRQLVRAAIEGIEAIWAVDRRARIVHVDPIIHVAPPIGRPELASAADAHRMAQFEAWDMLCGGAAPELGGDPKYLDIIGMNFYHDSEIEEPGGRIRWEIEPRDPRWRPLREMMAEVWRRYRRPLFLSETSHVGIGRAKWIREITAEVMQARDHGVPIEGICVFPIIDRNDWEHPNHWHHSGLWELLPDHQGYYHRVLNPIYAAELRRCMSILPG
jgi:beta-glucosidase/6-phospho-beta-glucosidase/beta-galactosidase